ncbi:ATP-binding protein [Bacteroidota bacterium]
MDLEKIDFTKLFSIADQLNCLVWSVDRSNKRAETFYSNSVEKLFGYTKEEINKFPDGIISLISEEDRKKIKIKLTRIEEDPTVNTANLIYPVITKGKSTVWIKEQLRIERNKSGKVLRTFSIAFDINDIKEETAELSDTIKNLSEMNNIKDKFISIVSHDLRSPFTTLLGFTEILLNEDNLSDEERDEYLSYIHDESKSQLQMINYLVDWSKLQTGRINIDPSRLHVKDVVANCVSTLTGAAVRKNLEIKTSVPDNLYINADERIISQAISNLIGNSIKFSESGKIIQILADKFKDGLIEIVVKDEGIGIAEENQQKLFKIDFKYQIPGTKGEKGTGLGLALVKEIIKKHDGDIWFYSKVKEGSEFHITIPEAKNVIMIVDENSDRRTNIRSRVEKDFSDFEIIETENGYKALNTAKEIIPSLIIINHVMPLMDGLQFVETLKGTATLKNIPVIVTAEKIGNDVLKKYTDLKIEKVIDKSGSLDDLSQLIKENIL